jgi:hypothetical protein
VGWKDDARQRVKENKQGARFKLEEGENTFRLLPSKAGPDDPPYREIRMHHNVGPDTITMRCGKDADGKGKCWLCDIKIPQLSKSDSPGKRAMAGKMASKLTLLVQVSPVSADTGKFGAPKPWQMDMGGAKAASTIILSLLSSTRFSYEDPVKGKNLTIERSGTGLKTTYGTATADEKPTKVPGSILAAMKDFDELTREYSAKAQEAAYFGRPMDDVEDETPAPRAGKGRQAVNDDPDPDDPEADPDAEGLEPDPDDPDPNADPDDPDADPNADPDDPDVPAEGEEGYEEPEPETPPPTRRRAAAPPPPAPRQAAKPAPKPAAKKPAGRR